ncbi:MAG: MFS transporter [Gammaproteobacteria bacterium]|nr:MFS transporter [Gammaproteobacteria bacterium]
MLDYALFLLLFLYGACNIGVSICYVIARESNADEVSATAMAFANMASVLIGAFFQPLVGWILDLHWDHQLVNGIPTYSTHAYHMALLLLPLCFTISFVAALLVKESYGKRVPAPEHPAEKNITLS